MPTKEQYQELMGEIIKKQMAILGPEIAILKARQIQGIKVDDSGTVISLGDPEEKLLQNLIDKYIELSGQIVKNILTPVFAKYPNINVKIK